MKVKDMKLVKNLPRKWNKKKTYKYSVGLFQCPECGEEVERNLQQGKAAKTCGCTRRIVKTFGLIFVKRTKSKRRKGGKLDGYGIFKCPLCGSEIERIISEGKKMKSCGCVHPKGTLKHGKYQTRLYHIWNGMKQRCLNKNSKDYANYGGRGISVFEGWKKDFTTFETWALKNGYGESLQIDRIDNDSGYFPENCRWVSIKKNSRNRRTSKLNETIIAQIKRLYASGKHSQKSIADKFKINQQYVSQIVNGARWTE